MVANTSFPGRRPFEDIYRTVRGFLANPWKLWASDHHEHKTMVLELAFGGRIPHDRKEGYRTAIPTLPFKVLAGFSRSNGELVGPEGLEPPTTPL